MSDDKKPDWMKHVPTGGNPRLYEPLKPIPSGGTRENAPTEAEIHEIVKTMFKDKNSDNK